MNNDIVVKIEDTQEIKVNMSGEVIPKIMVQADWNESDPSKEGYIKNKPAIPSKTSDLTNDSGFIDDTYHDNTKQDVLSGSDSIDITSNVVSVKETYKNSIIQESKDYTDKSIKDLLFYIGGKTLEEQTDNTIAYEKIVPSGALKYASLDKLGGMSYKSENLLDLDGKIRNNDGTDLGNNITINGVLCNLDTENNTIALSGTTSIDYWSIYLYLKTPLTLKAGNSYTFDKFSSTITVYINGTTSTSNLTNLTEDITITRLRLYVHSINTLIDTTIKPMLVKGGTAPTEYQPYFTDIRDSVITSIESKDSNDNVIDTFTMPSQVIAMANYGKGINENVYNYILFTTDENGQFKVYFIEDVGEVDLGTLNYTYNSDTKRFETTGLQTLLKPIATSVIVGNLLCSIYETIAGQTQYDNINLDMTVSQGTTNYPTVRFRNLAYTDATTFKTAMSGVPLLYQKATTTITDITEYFYDNYIEVEENGSVVANNEYQQAVPSEITYLVEVNNND